MIIIILYETELSTSLGKHLQALTRYDTLVVKKLYII